MLGSDSSVDIYKKEMTGNQIPSHFPAFSVNYLYFFFCHVANRIEKKTALFFLAGFLQLPAEILDFLLLL